MATPVGDRTFSVSQSKYDLLRERFDAERAAHDDTKVRAQEDLAAAGMVIARLEMENKRLKREIADDNARATEQEREAFEAWKRACNKRDSVKFADGRRKAIRRAIKAGLTQAEILKVIETGARFPFLVFGRWSATGSPKDRKDDLMDFFRDEKRWESLLELADAPPPTTHDRRTTPRHGADRPYAPGECGYLGGAAPFDRFLVALQACNLAPHVSPSGQGTARCPVPTHNDSVKSLSFVERQDGAVLFNCHAGCRNDDIVGALGLDFSELFPQRKDG